MATTIPDRVQKSLDDSGKKQSQLAREIGLDPTKLSKALSGTRAFSTGELAAISDALTVDIYWLINGEASSFSPRLAYRHTFNGETREHEAPSDELAEQMERITLAYQQARLEPDARLDAFRAAVGTDAFHAENLPTEHRQLRKAARRTHRLWRDWLTSGKDPVADTSAFLAEHFGIDLIVADVAGAQRVNAQSLQVAGANVIVVERSGSWYSALFAIFHELAHFVTGALAWKGQGTDEDVAEFEKLANGFAGDVLLSRAELLSTPVAHLPEPELAEFLWERAISLITLRHRCASNHVEPPARALRQGDITLHWREAHGDARSRVWSAPSYPTRLVDRHQQLARSGDVPPDVLAWMLEVPVEELEVRHSPVTLSSDTHSLLEELGIPT